MFGCGWFLSTVLLLFLIARQVFQCWWVFFLLAIAYMKWKWKSLSRVWLQPHGLCSPWNSPGQNTWVGSLSLLQGIFPTQGSNPGFLHCRWILYQLAEPPEELKNTRMGSLSLLQQIFLTQESNWGLLHCRQILYQLSYGGKPLLDHP